MRKRMNHELLVQARITRTTTNYGHDPQPYAQVAMAQTLKFALDGIDEKAILWLRYTCT
jgi:hypothetical protein